MDARLALPDLLRKRIFAAISWSRTFFRGRDSGRAMGACIEENTFAAFLEKRLAPHRRARMQEHIVGCAACHSMLAKIAVQFSVQPETTEYAPPIPTNGNSENLPSGSVPFVPPAQIDEYRVDRKIGHGAMGHVYLGYDIQLDRPVAIKFPATAEPDERARQRVLVEAKAIARLKHPNVVFIYRVSEFEGQPYLVSEYVQGQSLDKLPKPVPWVRALTVGIGLARGLAAAHAHGVLHRDIKPANAILTAEGEVKLLDFGLAKLSEDQLGPLTAEASTDSGASPTQSERSSDTLAALTGTGVIIGTPRYMAPESWRGERSTPRTDVYSMGALLYELCTGFPPHHDAISLEELKRKVLHEEIPSLSSLVPSTNRRFSDLVARCLRLRPEERFASGEELCSVLEQLSRYTSHTSRRALRRYAWPTVILLIILGLGAVLAKFVAALRWNREAAVLGCSEDIQCPIDRDCNPNTGQCGPPGTSWRKLPAMHIHRGFTCAAYVPDAAYVFGGMMEADATDPFRPPIRTVEKFDFQSTRWSDMTPMPIATNASSCVVLDGRIFVIGGRVAVNAEVSENSTVVQVYDPKTNRWDAAARLKLPRAWLGAVVYGRKIYAVGGVGPQSSPDIPDGYRDTAEVYDPDKNSWRLLTGKLRAGRYMLGVSARGDRIYAVGGSSFLGRDPGEQSTDYDLVEALDPGTEQWELLGRLPQLVPILDLFPLTEDSLLLLGETKRTPWLAKVPGVPISDSVEIQYVRPPPKVSAHDSGFAMTPYGLFIAGGGGWGENTADAYLYRTALRDRTPNLRPTGQ